MCIFDCLIIVQDAEGVHLTHQRTIMRSPAQNGFFLSMTLHASAVAAAVALSWLMTHPTTEQPLICDLLPSPAVTPKPKPGNVIPPQPVGLNVTIPKFVPPPNAPIETRSSEAPEPINRRPSIPIAPRSKPPTSTSTYVNTPSLPKPVHVTPTATVPRIDP